MASCQCFFFLFVSPHPPASKSFDKDIKVKDEISGSDVDVYCLELFVQRITHISVHVGMQNENQSISGFLFLFLVVKTCLPLSNSQFSLVVSVLLELLLESGTWRLWHSEARKNTEVYSCVIGFGVCLVQWKIHFRYSEPENIVLFIYHSLWIQKLQNTHF